MCVKKHTLRNILMFNFLILTIMPNHIKNIVRINGDKKSIARCSEQIFKGGFSFENIEPMPEELNVERGSKSYTAKEWMKADRRDRKNIEKDFADKYGIDIIEAKAMLQRYADNVAKYGHMTWYGWHLEHWGTKWDAYEIEEAECYGDYIHIEFQTAWSTPQEVIKTLAAQYPDLTISVDFADEDLGSNCGSYGFLEGTYWERVGDFDFACELWGLDPVEEREYLEAE